MKILVVDDSYDNIELVTDILYSLDHEIIAANSGEQALHIVHDKMPDLILLDMNMPGLDGIDVLRELKADENTAQISVIMLTAMGDVEKRVEALQLGVDDYLTKPYSPAELIARVERRLKAKSAADALREQQKRISETFARFVSSEVVKQLLKQPDKVKLGGEIQDITILFADLEGFTSLSEITSPVELLQLLNAYHSFMVRIIHQYQGTIDKFIGDSVMALFNTPLAQPDHVAAAVKSALHIQNELLTFHKKLAPEHRLQINFGIHTGVAVVGNVGSSEVMNYSAVGDTVNIAARLQGLSRKGQILVSEAVYREVTDFVVGRPVGSLKVKGRNEPVMTYIISDSFLG